MGLHVYLNLPVDTGKDIIQWIAWDGGQTHNCGPMAKEAGVYECLWRPEEIDIENAGQLTPLLRDGVAKMESAPERFKKLNPPNGWGSYETLLSFMKEYLEACEKYPKATIDISR